MKTKFNRLVNIGLLLLLAFTLAQKVPQWWALYQEEDKKISRFDVVNISSGQTQAFPILDQKSVLIFWATWCGPCTVELKRINDAIAQGELLAEQIHAISIQENEELVRQEAHARAYKFNVYADPQGASLKSIKVFGTPTIYYLNQDSSVHKSSMGLSPLLISQISSFLTKEAL